MLNEKEAAELIQSDKKKKKVSWNDNQVDGKINERFLKIGTASTPYKAILNEGINQLMTEEGYSEIEATAIMGKPITPSGTIILKNPIFYQSKESIDKRLLLEREKKESNRYSFFSISNIGVGVVVLAAAAAIGIIATKNK